MSRAELVKRQRLLLILSIWAAAPADAQFVTALDARSGVARSVGTPWLRESQVAPMVQGFNTYSWFRFDGLFVERAGALLIPRTSLRGAANSPAFGPLRFNFAFDAARSIASATHLDSLGRSPNRTMTAAATASASLRFGHTGVWVGTSYGRTLEMELEAAQRPRFSGGVWRVIGNAVASIAIDPQALRVTGNRIRLVRDSVYVDSAAEWHYINRTFVDSGAANRTLRWANVQSRVDWTLGRLLFTATMSGRRATDSLRSKVWGAVSAVAPLSSRISLVIGAGSRPVPDSRTLTVARFATLGLRLSPSAFVKEPLPPAVRPDASALVATRVSADSVALRLRVPGARVVEISGDFNRWTPVKLVERSPGVWELTLMLLPGVHRINVRVDGDAWTVPPGLPSVEDEFNGRVGILVLK